MPRTWTPVLCMLALLLLLPALPGCQRMELPSHTAWVHWTFPKRGEQLRTLVEIHDDPGEDVGLYLVPYSSSIDGTNFYYGIQTNVHSEAEGWSGKGLIFSRWGSMDLADTRPGDGGWNVASDGEGEFVGVRRNLDWEPGGYLLTLERTEADGEADWFELRCTPMGTFETITIGSLRFPRSHPNARASIDSEGMAVTEVYSGVRRPRDVPAWHVDLAPSLDGQKPTKAVSEYPAFPYAEFEAADVWYDEVKGEVHMAFGAGIERSHDPGELFSR